MFTGIIETVARIEKIEHDQGNLHLTLSSDITHELKIDQSVSHNGICLTVVEISGNTYTVTAIAETISKTSLGNWKIGDLVNLERAMKLGDRLDGHIVQGHVDGIGTCISVEETAGSWKFTFSHIRDSGNITIEKGSITVDGVSLTVVDSQSERFSVAIIPYTYEHTGFKNIREGSIVNLEFDVIGKYVTRLHHYRQ